MSFYFKELEMPSDAELCGLKLQGLSSKQIAETFGLSPKSVRGRISGYVRGTRNKNTRPLKSGGWKLSQSEKEAIKLMISNGRSLSSIARHFDVSVSLISLMKDGKR